MTTLHWKLNRLRLMGGGEVFWRVRQALQKRLSLLGFGLLYTPPPPTLAKFGANFLNFDFNFDLLDRAALISAADDVLAGRWNVFVMRGVNLGFPPQWNRDPKTGIHAPMIQGKAIDYRVESLVGDIKYLWEPNRHLELVTLALAWRITGDLRYSHGARQLLESWFEQSPYPKGVHWTSSLELSVRLINWSFAWHILGGADSNIFQGESGERFKRQWLDSICQHCHFISNYFSLYSSANNHLFGEYAGLFVASVTWPLWEKSNSWYAISKEGLEREALLQNWEDGVNKEQAIYYHHEVMDMMIICQMVAKANSSTFSGAFLERLERMAEFVSSLMNVRGMLPMIGDSDDAQMVRLSYENEWNPYRSLLATCALLFERGDFRRKAGNLDDKNRWLFGTDGLRRWNSLDIAEEKLPRQSFQEGGYWILGSEFGTQDEVQLVVDAAPLGYLSIAAHGHADALSFTLSVAGVEFLVDPGTFSYHTQKLWRDYFRGTSAHNTLRVDGVDQSEIGGNFMWLEKASAWCERWDQTSDLESFIGAHDGYCRLTDKVKHYRKIELNKNSRIISVIDQLECEGSHDVEAFWHFGEECLVTLQDNCITAIANSRSISMSFDGYSCESELFRGDENLPLGWISRKFDKKVPIFSLRRKARVFGKTVFVTNITY